MDDKDINKFAVDSELALSEINQADIGVKNGSKTYDNAMKSFRAASDQWKALSKRGDDYEMTKDDVEKTQKAVFQAMVSAEIYLQQKEEEQRKAYEKANKGRKPGEPERQPPKNEANEKRIAAIKKAKENLEKQTEYLDMKQAMIESRPAREVSELSDESDRVAQRMQDSYKNIKGGSKEFKNAQVAFDHLNDHWKSIKEKGPDYVMNEAEMGEIIALADKYDECADKYLLLKDGKNIKANTQERVDAINDGKELVREMRERLRLSQEQMEEVPTMSAEELSEKNKQVLETAKGMDKNPSGEYKEVVDLMEKNQKLIDGIKAKGPDYQMTSKERQRMQEYSVRASRAIDSYMEKNRGKQLDAVGQMRYDTMKDARELFQQQRRAENARRLQMRNDAMEMTPEEISAANNMTQLKLDEAAKSGIFRRPDDDYKDAVASYKEVNEDMEDFYSSGLDNDPEAAQEKIDSLLATRKKIAKFIDKTEGKNLNSASKARVDAMQEAYENINQQIDRLEAKNEIAKKYEDQKKDTKAEKNITKLKEKALNATGKERIMADAAANSAEALSKLSKKGKLTDYDKAQARYHMASMMFERNLSSLPPEKRKKLMPSNQQEYEKAVRKYSQSDEFKNAYPDSAITKEECAAFASNPGKAASALVKVKKAHELSKNKPKTMEKSGPNRTTVMGKDGKPIELTELQQKKPSPKGMRR